MTFVLEKQAEGFAFIEREKLKWTERKQKKNGPAPWEAGEERHYDRPGQEHPDLQFQI